MVRPAFALVVVVALAGAADAAHELPSHLGMYSTAQTTPLAMLDSTIAVHVHGAIAEAIVTQTFRNDADRVTEATYIFPLPPDAAVSAMEIETDTRTVHASIELREQAQQRYERAVADGLGAGLLDQERPDVFTQTVSAIPAHGTVTVTLRFDTVAQYRGGTWELALPMVIAPRYVPGTASGRPTTGSGRAPDTDRAPDASRVTPAGSPGAGGSTEVTLDLDDADDVTSPTHELTQVKSSYRFVDAKSDHDAIVRWKAKTPAAGWVEADASGGGGFAAVVVEARAAKAVDDPLHVTLLLDHAATTRGDADAVKKPIVRALLGALGGKDRVAVAGSETLDAAAPEQIWKTLEDRWTTAHGKLDLGKAIASAHRGDPIVLVTDGLVTDDAAVLAAAKKIGAPIHVIGIGPAPNRSLLSAIATATGGTIRFAVVGDDLAALAHDVRADVASQPEPLAINWGTLAASDVVPATLPRLGAGQAVIVLARVKKVQTANARVRGDVFGFAAVTPGKTPDGATTTRGPLARRWAKLKLDDLIVAGSPKAISEHALRYGLVSPYTSMVAIGTEVVSAGGVKHSVAVPVSVPAGMQWQLVQREIAVEGTKQPKATEEQSEKNKKKPAKDKHEAEPRGGEAAGAGAGAGDVTTVDVTGSTVKTGTKDEEGAEKPSEDDEDGRNITRDHMQNAPSPAPMTASGSEYDAEDTVGLESGYSVRRRTRFSIGLGAGLSIVNREASPVGELSLRIERMNKLILAGEGSLWLVDGLHGQGRALAQVGVHGIGGFHRLDLLGGTGLTFNGNAVGPALNLQLRTRLTHRLSGYLRYDGALLLRTGTYDGQNATSAGIEASF